MSSKLATVILPCYNCEKYIGFAVDSILCQSHSNLELIIIDDGSTDGSATIINGFKDDRIVFLRQENRGKANAVNNALDLSRGEYWMLQDADDVSHVNRLEVLITKLEKERSLGAVFSGNDLIIDRETLAPRFEPRTVSKCKELIDQLKLPAHDACGLYRSDCTTLLRFDENLRIGQGVDFVLRFGELHKIEVVGACLYSHRVNHFSTTHKSKINNILNINTVFQKASKRRNVPYNPIKERHPLLAKFFPHRDKDNFITYAVESVAPLSRAKHRSKALATAWFCIKRHPLDPLFYKPLLNFLYLTTSMLLKITRNRQSV